MADLISPNKYDLYLANGIPPGGAGVPSVVVHRADANGNQPFLWRLAGPDTGLVNPQWLAIEWIEPF